MKNDIIQMFKEFMILNYIGQKKPDYIPKLKDLNLGNNVILRQNYSYDFICLTNGNTIIFPKELIDILTSFNTYYGDRIFFSDQRMTPEELFLKLGISLICYINQGKLDEAWNTVLKIIKLKSQSFREYCLKEFNIKLEPIKFISQEDCILL